MVRLDEYVVRLEDTLEKKTSEYFKHADDTALMIKNLERDRDELRNKVAGSVPLDKADQWAQSLRDLTDQKHKAVEEYSEAKKQTEFQTERAQTLQIQLDDQKLLVKQLTQQIKDKEGTGVGDSAAVESITSQFENMTTMKLENMRLNRLVKQLQEREAHLEHCNQQSEKEVRKLEEQLVMREEETGANSELNTQVQALRARVQELEQVAPSPVRLASSPAKRAVTDDMRDVKVAIPPPITAVEARTMDHHAIEAMRQQIVRLTDALQEKDDKIESLNKELDQAALGGGGGGAGRREGAGGDLGSTEAAQHTQEVARLTIDRLEKNVKRKTDLVTKYQEQLREAREQYMQQKELDNEQIEQLREELAKKTHEGIQNLRTRAQQPVAGLSGPAAEDADAVFAEKDKVIQALNAEMQSLKRKEAEQKNELQQARTKMQKDSEELERVKAELKVAESKKPSQVLETLVLKLKKQLADKNEHQVKMKEALAEMQAELLRAGEEAEKKAEKAATEAGGGGEDDKQLAEQGAKLKKKVRIYNRLVFRVDNLPRNCWAEIGEVQQLQIRCHPQT
jgi:DNA repair exonuclease SbcCD ATPase subunit